MDIPFTVYCTAILFFQAVAIGVIQLLNLPFRKAMKAKNHMVVILLFVLLSSFYPTVNKKWMIKKPIYKIYFREIVHFTNQGVNFFNG